MLSTLLIFTASRAGMKKRKKTVKECLSPFAGKRQKFGSRHPQSNGLVSRAQSTPEELKYVAKYVYDIIIAIIK